MDKWRSDTIDLASEEWHGLFVVMISGGSYTGSNPNQLVIGLDWKNWFVVVIEKIKVKEGNDKEVYKKVEHGGINGIISQY